MTNRLKTVITYVVGLALTLLAYFTLSPDQMAWANVSLFIFTSVLSTGLFMMKIDADPNFPSKSELEAFLGTFIAHPKIIVVCWYLITALTYDFLLKYPPLSLTQATWLSAGLFVFTFILFMNCVSIMTTFSLPCLSMKSQFKSMIAYLIAYLFFGPVLMWLWLCRHSMLRNPA